MLALTPLSLLLLMMATWRLSAMIAYEVGPWRLFVRLRKVVGIEPDDAGRPAAWNPDAFLAGLFVCLWCVSVWIGPALLVMVILWPPGQWLLVPLAISAGAIIIERLARGQ